MYVSIDDVIFCEGLEFVYVKHKSHASTACECLVHTWGFNFLLVKT